MSIDQGMDKEDVMCVCVCIYIFFFEIDMYIKILLCHKKE